jgi:hypothetical protein
MSKTSKDGGRFTFLLCAAIAASATWAAAQSPVSPLAHLHVRVYDYAQVPPKVLSSAEDQVNMIFREAGVNVAWVNLTPPKDPSQAQPVGRHPAGSAGIDLRIVGRFEATTRMLRYDAMGFAVPPDTAAISLEWVDKFASLGIAEEYQVLGAAMAHEIGHLFLGPNSHSPVGIMRAGWKEQDLLEASQARLTFTPDQSRRILTEVRQRQDQPQTTSASTLLK